MTEQTNPNQETNEDILAAAPSPEIASSLDVQLNFGDDDADTAADDAAVEEAEEEEASAGPGEYVEQERGGRTRRTATDIRLDDVNYKNIAVLSRFLDRRGRILSRRKTRVSAKMQRRVVREIKRARHLALLPYTADQTRIVRRRK